MAIYFENIGTIYNAIILSDAIPHEDFIRHQGVILRLFFQAVRILFFSFLIHNYLKYEILTLQNTLLRIRLCHNYRFF